MTDDFCALVSICKCEVSITVNSHTTNYESITSYFEWMNDNDSGVSQETIERCEAAGTIYEVQAYPNTPVSSYYSVAPTLGEAVAECLASVRSGREKKSQ